MSKKKIIRPIPIENFPNVSTNCLGFAIGSTENLSNTSRKYNLAFDLPIGKSFVYKLKELGYTNLPHEIQCLEDALSGEYVFRVIGFKRRPYLVRSVAVPIYDFHIVRREPNGIWVHKPGWRYPPCIVKDSDWSQFIEDYGSNCALFAYNNPSEEE